MPVAYFLARGRVHRSESAAEGCEIRTICYL